METGALCLIFEGGGHLIHLFFLSFNKDKVFLVISGIKKLYYE